MPVVFCLVKYTPASLHAMQHMVKREARVAAHGLVEQPPTYLTPERERPHNHQYELLESDADNTISLKMTEEQTRRSADVRSDHHSRDTRGNAQKQNTAVNGKITAAEAASENNGA